MNVKSDQIYDAFMCHATEDKEAVARPLAQALINAGLRIWYDEFSLKLGDSLRQSIERGLVQSRFGIVVISPQFFEKNWPQTELNGLFAKEMTGDKVIIPVWFKVEYSDIVKRSPIMADKVAAKITDGMDKVVEQILDVIEPNLIHMSKERLVVTLEPKDFRLRSGNWSVKTSIVVSNRSEKNIYALSVKIAIIRGNLKAEDLFVDIMGDDRSKISASPGLPTVSGDAIMFGCIDSLGREAVLLVISRIGAKQNREIIVSAKNSLKECSEILASRTIPK